MSYSLRQGTKQGALEVIFDSIPSAETRATLKENKMRWNASKGCWWGFITEEQINDILCGVAITSQTAQTQQNYKPEYIFELLKQYEGNKREYWQTYYNKSISDAYKIGRYIIAFDKPTIKTSFCFGYGYCGRTTAEDMERAANMAHYARTKQDYFIKENLKQFNDILENIEIVKTNRLPMDQQDWSHCRSGNDVSNIAFFKLYSDDENILFVRPTTYAEDAEEKNKYFIDYLTDEEIETYKQAVIIEQNKLQKRLKTYLKKYGLTKLNTWSYLSD